MVGKLNTAATWWSRVVTRGTGASVEVATLPPFPILSSGLEGGNVATCLWCFDLQVMEWDGCVRVATLPP